MTTKPDARKLFREVTKEIARFLTEDGFVRGKKSIVRERTETLDMICLSGEGDTGPDRLMFAVNYGVVHRWLHVMDVAAAPSKDVSYIDAHTWGRYTHSDGTDFWFSLRATDDPHVVAAECVARVRSKVLPKFDALRTDDDFIAMWREHGGGITRLARYFNLALLLAKTGRTDEAAAVAAQVDASEAWRLAELLARVEAVAR
ncbi:MAG: hypothetical protein NVS3B10_08340 [Polyangiales bacterium]